jgi:hypothetical protein
VLPFDHDARVAAVLQRAQRRQLARVAKVPADARVAAYYTQINRWNRELLADLEPLLGADAALTRAHAANLETLKQLHAATTTTRETP